VASPVDLAVTVYRHPHPSGLGLLLPGLLDGRRSPGIDALARALPEIGLTGVAFDPRGVDDSAGDVADYTPSVQLKDIDALLGEHAIGSRTVLIGHCYGAFLAGIAADLHPWITDVVALMPTRFFIWPEDYDIRKDTWRLTGERKLSGRAGNTLALPHSAVEDALRFDLPSALRNLRQRVLFVAGTEDELIPLPTVVQLHEECGSPRKELTVLPVQHDFADLPNQIEMVKRAVLEWLGPSR
jgi:pimeloyl-ACP methyl ester carboxylesterase